MLFGFFFQLVSYLSGIVTLYALVRYVSAIIFISTHLPIPTTRISEQTDFFSKVSIFLYDCKMLLELAGFLVANDILLQGLSWSNAGINRATQEDAANEATPVETQLRNLLENLDIAGAADVIAYEYVSQLQVNAHNLIGFAQHFLDNLGKDFVRKAPQDFGGDFGTLSKKFDAYSIYKYVNMQISKYAAAISEKKDGPTVQIKLSR